MGLTTSYTGIINLSNCTSAWDRKATGSFAGRFLAILKQNGHSNFVLGFESFTESVDENTELEVAPADREKFLAHKLTERCMASLMIMNPTDKKPALVATHQKLQEEADSAKIEYQDFYANRGKDKEAATWAEYYLILRSIILTYLANAEDAFNEKAISQFQEDAMELMKKFNINNLGGKIKKVEAIPVIHA